MNQKQAKRLRKEAYGDNAVEHITERIYAPLIRFINNKAIDTGAKICTRFRKKYLELKKEYKR